MRPGVEEAKVFRHPLVGELRLHFEALWVSAAPGQRVYFYLPDAGSPTADALELLARHAEGVDG